MSKADPGTEVPRAEVWLAQERWILFYGGFNTSGRGSFASYLGVTRLTQLKAIRGVKLVFRKSAVDKIKLLNSPHWHTILKMREARRK